MPIAPKLATITGYAAVAVNWGGRVTVKFFDHTQQLNRIQKELDRRFKNVLQQGQFIQGPEVREIESVLANYLGVKHCISTSNGTDALLAALMASGVSEGDEVITPAFSYIAAAESIKILGATPIYIDVDRNNFNIDVNQLQSLLSDKTKAIIAIDLFGQSADYNAIDAVLDSSHITVIEDAAQSFGARYHQRKAGSLADISTTSFFPTKPLGCFGDGGAIFTNNTQLAQVLREITLHGQREKYQHKRLGFNGRLDTIQAAVLLAKMPEFDQEISDRQAAATFYNELVAENLSEWSINYPLIENHNTSTHAQYTLKVTHRNELQRFMASEGIPTAIHYPIPIYKQWQEKSHPQLTITESLCKSVISLPMYAAIPRSDQIKVIKTMAKGLKHLTSTAEI